MEKHFLRIDLPALVVHKITRLVDDAEGVPAALPRHGPSPGKDRCKTRE